MHSGEQCKKHEIYMVFVHKQCVWYVLCLSRCTHTRNGHISVLNSVFRCTLVNNVKNMRFACFFVHKLSDLCVNAEQCVFTRFATFCVCNLAHKQNNGHISVQKLVFWCTLANNVKNMRFIWFLCINNVFGMFCAFLVAHTRNGHISVLNRVFRGKLVNNVKNMRFPWFLCINRVFGV